MNNAGEYDELKMFHEKNIYLMEQSINIRMSYCWSLFYEGKLEQSYKELGKISKNFNNKSYRLLFLNLGLSLGNLSILHEFLDNEFSQIDVRTTEDLLRDAQLCITFDRNKIKDFIFGATRKDPNNAYALLGAYDIASKAGLDDLPEVSLWLKQAIQLSKDGEPIKMVSLDDLHNLMPENNAKLEHSTKLYQEGSIPIYLAGLQNNKSLANIMLFPALGNAKEMDLRNKSIIPSYSGVHNPNRFELNHKIGISRTSILTLSYLNIFKEVVNHCTEVSIPHSTLCWLLQEKN